MPRREELPAGYRAAHEAVATGRGGRREVAAGSSAREDTEQRIESLVSSMVNHLLVGGARDVGLELGQIALAERIRADVRRLLGDE